MNRPDFDKVLVAFLPSLERYARSLAFKFNRPDDWRDIAQETAARMLEHCDGYDGERGGIGSLAWRIMLNKLTTDYNRRQLIRFVGYDAAEFCQSAPDAEAVTDFGVMWGCLNDETRLYYLGYTYSDVAKEAGVSKSTVCSRVAQSAEKLSRLVGYSRPKYRRSSPRQRIA